MSIDIFSRAPFIAFLVKQINIGHIVMVLTSHCGHRNTNKYNHKSNTLYDSIMTLEGLGGHGINGNRMQNVDLLVCILPFELIWLEAIWLMASGGVRWAIRLPHGVTCMTIWAMFGRRAE